MVKSALSVASDASAGNRRRRSLLGLRGKIRFADGYDHRALRSEEASLRGTAYEYLERRFDAKTRSLTSFLFLVSRAMSCGTIISAPAVVFSAVFGWPLTWSVTLIGEPTVIYTVLGGVQAVTWADVKQMVKRQRVGRDGLTVPAEDRHARPGQDERALRRFDEPRRRGLAAPQPP